MRLLIVFSFAIIAIQAIPIPQSKGAPLVELTSELLAKHSSGGDDFDLDQAEADPRKRKDQASREKRSPVASLVELTSELLAKHSSGGDDFEVHRKRKDQASREKRSPVAPLVELTSELLKKHSSGGDDFDLDQAEADPRKKTDQASRDKRSPVAPVAPKKEVPEPQLCCQLNVRQPK